MIISSADFYYLSQNNGDKRVEQATFWLRKFLFRLHLTIMAKQNLMGYSLTELEQLMLDMGEKKFRGGQLFKWLYRDHQTEFEHMTDFSKELRKNLEDKYEFRSLTLEHRQVSEDGTQKFLFKLEDDLPVETVLIPDFGSERKTVCISSQVGCAVDCQFCATGRMGFKRDLTAGEIVAQLIYLREEYGLDAFSNVVMMGMGEPLANFDNVVKAIELMVAPTGMMLSRKKITVSTSGYSPKIKKLADTGLNICLAISLHAAIQEKRVKIMPIAKTFGLEKLMQSIRYYADKSRTQVMFEYIIFDNFNDTLEDVRALAKLVHGLPCKINLLAYNPVDGLDFKRPSEEKMNWFGGQLAPRVPVVTVRKSRGRDIDAACGQLAAKQRLGRKIDV